MKKTLILLIITAFITGTSCKKYLDVNNNVDAPAYVDAYLYLANITQQYTSIYYDNRALDPITQMMGTTSTYSAFGNMSYLAGSDAGGEIWKMVYFSQGKNLENLINQSMAAEDWSLAGIGYAIKAFSWDLMTKVHGELPLKDAFVPGKLSHNYDYQDSIYAQVRVWADKAIELLGKDDPHVYGTKISANDFIYKGDKTKWTKFAYAVLVRNYASLSNKKNFVSDYAPKLIEAAQKSFQSATDDAVVSVGGGSQSAPFSTYNNFWGTSRGNLSWSFFQHEYAVQVLTGSVPKYDQATGNKIPVDNNTYYPYELADKQIICDTLVNEPGHYDPRMAVKLGTTSNPTYNAIDNADSVKAYKYYGGTTSGRAGPIGSAPSFYGRNDVSRFSGDVNDGIGRWIYRDDAPYILTTCAEIKFCLAEAYWKMGNKSAAFEAFKDGVKADMDFTARYLYPGTKGKALGGDKISKDVFNSLAAQYQSGPYVGTLSMSDFSLSHIMMQKWVALYPWGAPEAWVDERKYQYDLQYTGDVPGNGNGYTETKVDQKWDTDPSKVYKGFYLLPAQVQGRRGTYDQRNLGAPAYRLRPRYNSEYMWNLASLGALKPIAGTADNYMTSIPWFAYPSGYPFK